MNNRIALALYLMATTSAFSQSSTLVLKAGQSINLPANQKMTITSLKLYAQAVEYGSLHIQGYQDYWLSSSPISTRIGTLTLNGAAIAPDCAGMVIVGPATVSVSNFTPVTSTTVAGDNSKTILVNRVRANTNDDPFVSFLVESTNAANAVPNNAIVIPASASGSVNIQLETSTDMINWSPVNPGSFNTNNSANRFFRVRALTE